MKQNNVVATDGVMTGRPAVPFYCSRSCLDYDCGGGPIGGITPSCWSIPRASATTFRLPPFMTYLTKRRITVLLVSGDIAT